MERFEEELIGPSEEEDLRRYEEEKKGLDAIYKDWEKPPIRLLEGPKRAIYWHIAPYRRLSLILKTGLKPSSPKTLGFDIEVTENKVFLGEDPADCYSQLAFADSEEVRYWALIELDMSGYPHTVWFDESGFPYTTHPISPHRILEVWKYDFARGIGVGKEPPERFGPFKELV